MMVIAVSKETEYKSGKSTVEIRLGRKKETRLAGVWNLVGEA